MLANRIFLVLDVSHSERMGKFETEAEAVDRLKSLAEIAWDHEPNRAPCISWKTCGRAYHIIECDTSTGSITRVTDTPALNISAEKVEWLLVRRSAASKETDERASEYGWTLNDLKVLTDPLDHIRRHPQIYLGEMQASGALLTDRMGSDLAFLGAMPIDTQKSDGWWIVTAGSDWLGGHVDVLRAFTRIRPFPERGANDMHAEVLLTAFATAVATFAAGEWQWIVAPDPLPDLPRVSMPASGRAVAFRCDA